MRVGHLVACGVTVAAVIAAGAAPASAQDCKIRRLGGITRFSEPLASVSALQAMFKSKEGEIERMLGQAGWSGKADDLEAAIAAGRVTKQSVPKGTRFEWMFRRVDGVPEIIRNECYGGAEPFSAWAVDVDSNGRRWHLVVPEVCGNVALVSSEALPASPAATAVKTEPQPPPRTAPPAAAPPPAPAPPPAQPAAAAAAPAAAPAVTETAEIETPQWNFELFAGYFFPEELDEDLAYGLRFGRRGINQWGWQVAGSWFDVADSQGFSGQKVDADLVHVDFSMAYYPGDRGFLIFFGPGFASGNVDVPGTTEDLSDDVFSAHVGLGYELATRRSFYVKPDVRLRWYELEGFGQDGGKDSQITYEAAIALGWRFGK